MGHCLLSAVFSRFHRAVRRVASPRQLDFMRNMLVHWSGLSREMRKSDDLYHLCLDVVEFTFPDILHAAMEGVDVSDLDEGDADCPLFDVNDHFDAAYLEQFGNPGRADGGDDDDDGAKDGREQNIQDLLESI